MEALNRRVNRAKRYSEACKCIKDSDSELTLNMLEAIKEIIETDVSYQDYLIETCQSSVKTDITIFELKKADILSKTSDNIYFSIFERVATKLFGESFRGFILKSLFNAQYVDMKVNIVKGIFKYWNLQTTKTEDYTIFSLVLDVDEINKRLDNYCDQIESSFTYNSKENTLEKCVNILCRLRLVDLHSKRFMELLHRNIKAYTDTCVNSTNEKMMIRLVTVLEHYK